MIVARPFIIALGLAALAALSALGDLAARAFGLAIPGPVLALAAYAAALLIAPAIAGWTLPAARLLTGVLGALIVPAAVGLLLFLPLLAHAALALTAILVASTLITGLATALLMRVLRP